MKIGVIGLGKMGKQIVARLLADKHEVLVISSQQQSLDQAQELGASVANDAADLVHGLGGDPLIWIMIPASAVENQLAALIDLMPRGGVIIDGGNSDYRETKRRALRASERGVILLDVGVSGGLLGLEHGFSIMVGGDKSAVDRLEPLFASLSVPSGWGYFGSAGAGHFTKMIHNAIEYGQMEALAEGYRFLKESGDYPGLNLAEVALVWQHGSIIASQLNQIVGQELRRNPELTGIDGYVGTSEEPEWALQRAKEIQMPLPVVEAAVAVRLASAQGSVNFGTKLLATLRHSFGGHPFNKPPANS